MSVIKSKRNESNVQFLDTARELEIFTIRKLKKFNKSASKTFKDTLLQLSMNVYNNLIMANAIFNDSKEKIARRTHYLDESLRNLYCMSPQINVAKEMKLAELSEYGWLHWMELVAKEISLVKAIKLSDKAKLDKL